MARLAVWVLAVFFCLCPMAEAVPQGLQMVPVDEIEAAAAALLEETISGYNDSRRHTVELTRMPRPFRAPAGEVTYELSLPYGVRFGSTTSVYARIIIDGMPDRRLSFSYRVHVFDRVVVAAKNLQPRRLLESSDVRLEERDVSGLNAKYLTDVSEAVGRETNRLVKSGAVFTKNMVLNPVIIEPGATVYIVAEKNGVRVKTEGVSLDRGRRDGVIRVRNANSAKVLRARVLDESTVQIVL